jgi:2Fe-2S ferredoxin
MSDAESDRLDMGFDVRSYSRLGCQVKVGEHDLVVELTQESIRTWYDEHPQARKG